MVRVIAGSVKLRKGEEGSATYVDLVSNTLAYGAFIESGIVIKLLVTLVSL